MTKESENEKDVTVLERAPEPNENLLRHQLSALWPDAGDDELKALAADIVAHGLREKIVRHDGAILDGWQRVRACSLAGIELGSDDFTDFVDSGEECAAFNYVVSINQHRRHLTAEEKLEMAAKLKKHLGIKPGRPSAADAGMHQEKRRQLAEFQESLGVSDRSVERLEQVAKADLELVEEVKSGKKSLHKAAREAQKRIAGSEYDKAFEKVQAVCGKSFAAAIKEDQIPQLKTPKNVIELAALSDDQIQAVMPGMRLGWKLSQALSYLTMELNPSHSFEAGINLMLSKGEQTLDLNFDGFLVTIIDCRKESQKAVISPAPAPVKGPKKKKVQKAFVAPSKEEFVAYAKERKLDPERADGQWEAWKAGDWFDGNGYAIVNWKLKLLTFSKCGYGVFGGRPERRHQRTNQVDERARINKAARESEALNRKYANKQ